MKPAVAEAIAELKSSSIGTAVRTKEDADGGAFVIVDGVTIGPSFKPPTTWIGFHIVWSCPDGDTYPHFIDAAVQYVGDGPTPNEHADGALPMAMARGQTMPGFELEAIQVSRRSNRRDAETDTPLQKLLRIIDFLQSR